MSISSTVIAALKYRDGVVIGADSQTSDPLGQMRWQSRKLKQIANRSLVAGFSGQTSVINRLQVAIDNSFSTSRSTTFDKLDRVMGFINALQPVYEEQSKKHPNVPLGRSIWNISAVGLVACWAEGKPHILEIEHNGEIDKHAYFRAIGSGANSAQAVWAAFGAQRLSQYAEGMALQIMWRILKVCIETEFEGVGEPIVIWSITKDKTRQIQSAELDNIRQVEDRDFLFSLISSEDSTSLEKVLF